jgi:uncharacterized repeat protein (TIGR01451 family)
MLCAGLAVKAQSQAENAAKSYLGKQCKEWGLAPEDLAGAVLADEYQTAHNGVAHLFFRQTAEGIPVHPSEIQVHMDRNGRVLKVHNGFVAQAESRILRQPRSLDEEGAIRAAASALGLPQPQALQASAGADGIRSWLAPGLSRQPLAPVLQYYASPDGALRLSWNFQLYESEADHWWNLWIDAASGSLLHKEDWIVSCAFETPLASDDCEPDPAEAESQHRHALQPEEVLGGGYRVYPFPVESPSHGARVLLADVSDTLASPFGWHDTDGQLGAEFTITRGNNVYAQEDRDANNQPGYAPDGSAALLFDFPLDLSQPPASYQDAAITNLFYWNNLVHDVWYQYGFDEPSGNFQQNNYGRGGNGGDFVVADAQDGSGFNNANFSTPPDGQNGRMQMFIWTSGPPTAEYLTINSPVSVAGPYVTAGAGFGPGIPSAPLAADLVLAQDGSGNAQGCLAFTNNVAGKFAVVDRGGCTFVVKVKNAQNAGALAVIVVNNTGGTPTQMGGTDPTITIPSVHISQANGNSIKNAMAIATVNGTLLDDPLAISGFDSGLDNGIIVHEYGHGISTRLTGGPSASCLFNEEQAGEGWSDWFALVMTVEPGDNGAQARGIATYASGQPISGGGIRPFRYSTNLSINPVTYDDIKTLSVPHGVGSVMCSMLWDLYWALVDEYGYDSDLYRGNGGNNLAMQLVIDGLKLQPCAPGFVDVRDAILLADQINNNGANQCLIWEVFARRGLGYSADQGASSSRSDGIEAYDLPPSCRRILFMEKFADKTKAPAGDTITFTLQVSNRLETPLTNVIITDTLPANLSFIPGSSSCVSQENAGVVSLLLGNLAPGQQVICEFQARILPNSPFSVLVLEDDLEDLSQVYQIASLTGTQQDAWRRDTTDSRSGQYSFFVPNAPSLNDQVWVFPAFVPDSGDVLSFWHSYHTEEGWDGGLVEILATATDPTWRDLGQYMIEHPYSSVVGSNNPAGERDAFGGNSDGYVQTKIDLSSFAGQPVFIRFRFVSDDNTAEVGWRVDDITVGNEVRFSNRACVSAAEGNAFCAQQASPTLVLEADSLSTSLGNPLAGGLRLYPNPAARLLTLESSRPAPGPWKFRLLDLAGREVWAQLAQPAGQRAEIQLPALPDGLYLAEIQAGEHYFRQQLLIQR